MKDKNFNLEIILKYDLDNKNKIGNKILLKCQNDFDEDFFDLKSDEFSEEVQKYIIDFGNNFYEKYLKSFDKENTKNSRKINFKISSNFEVDKINDLIEEHLSIFKKLNENSETIVEIEYNDIIIEVNNSHTLESIKTELGI